MWIQPNTEIAYCCRRYNARLFHRNMVNVNFWYRVPMIKKSVLSSFTIRQPLNIHLLISATHASNSWIAYCSDWSSVLFGWRREDIMRVSPTETWSMLTFSSLYRVPMIKNSVLSSFIIRRPLNIHLLVSAAHSSTSWIAYCSDWLSVLFGVNEMYTWVSSAQV